MGSESVCKVRGTVYGYHGYQVYHSVPELSLCVCNIKRVSRVPSVQETLFVLVC